MAKIRHRVKGSRGECDIPGGKKLVEPTFDPSRKGGGTSGRLSDRTVRRRHQESLSYYLGIRIIPAESRRGKSCTS